jgi:hypothetical protein
MSAPEMMPMSSPLAAADSQWPRFFFASVMVRVFIKTYTVSPGGGQPRAMELGNSVLPLPDLALRPQAVERLRRPHPLMLEVRQPDSTPIADALLFKTLADSMEIATLKEHTAAVGPPPSARTAPG